MVAAPETTMREGSSARHLPALLDAVETGTVQPWSLGPGRTRQLVQSADPAIRERAQKLLVKSTNSDRQAVYDRYLPALTMKGNAERGRQVFERVCSECHKVFRP